MTAFTSLPLVKVAVNGVHQCGLESTQGSFHVQNKRHIQGLLQLRQSRLDRQVWTTFNRVELSFDRILPSVVVVLDGACQSCSPRCH